nr:uncharacterized protein CFP56_11779 [Quercus suber]
MLVVRESDPRDDRVVGHGSMPCWSITAPTQWNATLCRVLSDGHAGSAWKHWFGRSDRRNAGRGGGKAEKWRSDVDLQLFNLRRAALRHASATGYRPPAHRDIQFVDQTPKLITGTSHGKAKPKLGQVKQYKWKGQVPDTASQPTGVKNTYMHQLKLLGTFIDLYLPDTSTTGMMSHYTALAQLPTIDLSAPLMQIAIVALGCAEIGTLHSDERWIHEARRHYAKALPMLAYELGKPTKRRMADDHILAVMVIFALCELFSKLTATPGRGAGWFLHIEGALQHMRTNGRGALSTPFGELLFHHVRHMTLCVGVVSKKPVALAAPEWLSFSQDRARSDAYIALYDTIVLIPGVLERVDLFFLAKTNKSYALELVEELCGFRDKLEQWLSRWYGSRDKSQAYEIVDVREMYQFSSLVEDRTYQTVFKFKSPDTCAQMQVFNHLCVVCDINILRLVNSLSVEQVTPPYGPSRRTTEDIERELMVAATSYCRGLPYCYEPTSGSLGRMGPLVLRLLQEYFESHGHQRELDWCLANGRVLQMTAGERSAALSTGSAESKQTLPFRDSPVARYANSAIYHEGPTSQLFDT